jgi:D-alanyl-D-alanine carboxypeptidase (penicillin-binding protein 5/6)
MYCMMVASANDTATVIAEHVGGTQDGFIAMMNKKAAELGCTGTHFSNVHGLHDENTYTTARDICRILDVALENPDFKAMFTAKSYVVPATNKTDEERQVETSNYMMSNAVVKKYLDPRVTGGKTGATDEAGRCLAATAEGGGMELLTIVMGAEATYEEDGLALKTFGSFEETAILLDYILGNYEYRQIFHEGQTVSQFPVENGTNSVVARPEMTRSTVLPKDLDESKLTWIYGDTASAVTAPVEQGQKLSTIQVWYGSKCLAQADLVAANAVPVWQAPIVPTIPTEQDDSGNWTVLLVICGILAGAAAVVVLIFVARRVVRQMRQSARRRRRQMGRRRSR